MPRLPKILAIFAIIFLLGALIIQQTVSGNRERVEILSNTNQNNISSTSAGKSETVLGEEVGKISVNDAIFEELDAIPGIGPKTAEKIINGRPWENLDDVLNLIFKHYRDEARRMLKL